MGIIEDLKREAERAARNLAREAERGRRNLERELEIARENFEKTLNKAKKDITDTAKKGVSDIESEANNATTQLHKTVRTSMEDVNRELTWVKEDVDAEATRTKAKLDREATEFKADVDTQATKAKNEIDKEITRAKGKLNAEATRLKDSIDEEATRAKEKIDRELTKLKADVDRAATQLNDDIERELTKAKDDIDDAVDAASVFCQSQLASIGDTLSEAEAKIREGKVVDALWHIATEPYDDAKEGFIAAISKSTLLNQAAIIAVSTFGSPAAVAAYSAWLTYETTGNLEAAIKTGIIAGASAYAGKSISKITPGTLTEAVKKELMQATVNASAIAASGGSQQDIEKAFISAVSDVALEKGKLLVTKWVETEVAPRIGQIDTNINTTPPSELIETAKQLHATIGKFKDDYDNLVSSGELLQSIIINEAGGIAQPTP
jgi:hypothetical protein